MASLNEEYELYQDLMGDSSLSFEEWREARRGAPCATYTPETEAHSDDEIPF